MAKFEGKPSTELDASEQCLLNGTFPLTFARRCQLSYFVDNIGYDEIQFGLHLTEIKLERLMHRETNLIMSEQINIITTFVDGVHIYN